MAALDLDRPSDAMARTMALPPRRLWPDRRAIIEGVAQARAALNPAAPEAIVAQLMRLRLHLPTRELSATEARLLMEDYLSDLRALPADVLADAVAEARRTCRWFPGIAELMALARPTLQRRRALLARLERMAALSETSPSPAPDPEERAAIALGLRRMVQRLRAGGAADAVNVPMGVDGKEARP